MDDKKREFLFQALAVYMRFGIKSITMDEMARQLGISKKTIYTYVKDKNDLVMQCVQLSLDDEACQVKDIASQSNNAIDEVFNVGEMAAKHLREVHPSIFFDMEKYHPDAFQIMKKSRNKLIMDSVMSNLKKGKKQGLYRENIDEEIIAVMYVAFIDALFNGDVFPTSKYPFIKVYNEYFKYHIRGIASDKGLKYLEEVKKNKKIDL